MRDSRNLFERNMLCWVCHKNSTSEAFSYHNNEVDVKLCKVREIPSYAKCVKYQDLWLVRFSRTFKGSGVMSLSKLHACMHACFVGKIFDRHEECQGASKSVLELGICESMVIKGKGFPRPDYYKMNLLQVGLNRWVMHQGWQKLYIPRLKGEDWAAGASSSNQVFTTWVVAEYWTLLSNQLAQKMHDCTHTMPFETKFLLIPDSTRWLSCPPQTAAVSRSVRPILSSSGVSTQHSRRRPSVMAATTKRIVLPTGNRQSYSALSMVSPFQWEPQYVNRATKYQ